MSLDYLIENNIFKIDKFEKKFDLFTNRIMFLSKTDLKILLPLEEELYQGKTKYINSWENSF